MKNSLVRACLGILFLLPLNAALAEDAATLGANAQNALMSLYASTPAAKALGDKAKAILVFPTIKKGGVVAGAQYGEGVLIENDKVMGYYDTLGASVGMQIGLEKYSYVLFFMSDKAYADFKASKGFEIGVGPSITIIDEGAAKNLTTTTAQKDIYAFIFGQKGLMGGMSLKGNKISKIEK